VFIVEENELSPPLVDDAAGNILALDVTVHAASMNTKKLIMLFFVVMKW
jgi:hypothetical protein